MRTEDLSLFRAILAIRDGRIRELRYNQFTYLWYVLFWPTFGLAFFFLERFWARPTYYVVSCPVDDMIPFCEYFLIPYMFWFAYVFLMQVYTAFFDPASFRRMGRFLIVANAGALLLLTIFPSCQTLRPESFARDNFFTQFLAGFYAFDTNTNVCPSLHVVEAVAVQVGAWNAPYLRTRQGRQACLIMTILIAMSTVFLKQHSIIDVAVAFMVCFVSLPFVDAELVPRSLPARSAAR